ncbi:amidase, partial [bacterium]|nr:amidase [bacterium]
MNKYTKAKNTSKSESLSRRLFLSYFTGIGMASTLLPGILWIKCQNKKEIKITKNMLKDAEKLAGITFTDEERELMLDGINNHLDKFERMRKIHLDNSIAPPLYFSPILPGMTFENKKKEIRISNIQIPDVTSDLEKLAFMPVTHLAKLIKSGKISSVELTKMYLSRLKKYGQKLKCVVTIMEDSAIKQAEKADKEIMRGYYRGILHGIPWGVKDIFARQGYKTTWGAAPYKNKVIDKDAAVIEHLDRAGAVLVVKLTSGALAQGDIWFGGKTRNPWNIDEGSSGSSAGPGSATSAGLVGFSIGTETNGSIVGPSARCGVTGLRPTFGRISRYGAMALSWSMDKVGPMCRTVEDCAVVFDAIHGTDGRDLSVVDIPFNWDYEINV